MIPEQDSLTQRANRTRVGDLHCSASKQFAEDIALIQVAVSATDLKLSVGLPHKRGRSILSCVQDRLTLPKVCPVRPS